MSYKLSYSTWGNEENIALKKVIKTGNFTMSNNVKLFEKKFATYLGRKYAVMTNSGSSANLIGVASLFFKKNNPLKRGDEVLVPAISWSTTYAPLQQYGLKLKFIDVNIDSLNVDVTQITKAISKKTKLITSVSILGCPADLIEINKICKKNNLYHFEDNCESLGAKINKNKTGTFGDFSTHSFFFSHHISTMEGGMFVTDNYELYCIAKSLRAHGWTRDLPKKNPLTKNNKKNMFEEYKFILPGYNVRPTELNAVVGLVQLKKLNNMIKVRRQNLDYFNFLFENDDRFIIQKTNDYHSSFCFPIILNNKSLLFRKKLLKLLSINNIEFRLITGGCFTEHYYKKYFNFTTHGTLKNAKKAHYFGFFIGNSSVDLKKEIYKFYKILKYKL